MSSLELSGRDHPELSMQTSMVEPLDVLEHLEFDVIETTPARLRESLC
jgi:hypothetical protein